MSKVKLYFQVLRDNEDLSYAGLQTLKMIENEFDRLNEFYLNQLKKDVETIIKFESKK